jgi:hypothetical protein
MRLIAIGFLFLFTAPLALADAPTPVRAVALQPTVWREEISVPASIAARQAAALAAERAGRAPFWCGWMTGRRQHSWRWMARN